MSFFTVYLDDSGTSPSQTVANATALVVPTKRTIAMEREWDTLKTKEHFTDFHTSEFVARNHKSEFANWDDTKQKRVFDRVRQIIKKFGVKVWSFSVDKPDYDAVIPNELRKYLGKSHYTWAARHVLTFLAAWRRHHKTEPLEFIFDWVGKSDPCRKEIEDVMDYAEREISEKGTPGIYTNYTFRHRKELSGLQCVDCLAWICYQYGILGFRKTPLHPLAKIAWQDFVPIGTGAGPDDWLTALVLKKTALQDWVAKEMASGESLKRFERWEREDVARISKVKGK